ncbi:TniB family NTP-binding protein [Burkholderia lata]|uniref:TniB family protein n=1 Tax=Burkholderia lata (strain ATCC 17760 / DSM 23089 / LMG 22485 / NCIMB 9086 / R18194 / 383) TaxID=482957 RepID=A0A6P2MHY7_BURL3|nr:TniB family NTP-binding protein [Burkholderia lata]VWB84867.1 TniB family protein [Burkholderia lata]
MDVNERERSLFEPPFAVNKDVKKSRDEVRMEALAGDPLQRAKFVETMLIRTMEFDQAEVTIESLMQRSEALSYPGGLCVIGEGGTGKSFIREYFSRRYPIEETALRTFCPVLAIQLFGTPTPRQLFVDLLSALGYRFVRDDVPLKKLTPILLKALIECSVKIIMIDEAHHLIPTSGSRKNKERLGGELGDVAKNLYDQCRLPFVWSGKPSLGDLFDADEQLKSRWPGTIRLAEYKCDKLWRAVLDVIDEALPMEQKCGLGEVARSDRVHQITRGNFRILKSYLSECVRLACADGEQLITPSHFERARCALSL